MEAGGRGSGGGMRGRRRGRGKKLKKVTRRAVLAVVGNLVLRAEGRKATSGRYFGYVIVPAEGWHAGSYTCRGKEVL